MIEVSLFELLFLRGLVENPALTKKGLQYIDDMISCAKEKEIMPLASEVDQAVCISFYNSDKYVL